MTPQRSRILEEVLRTRGHFGAEDLCHRLMTDPVKVSRATVYRALELLIDCGVVQRVRLEEDHVCFEVTRIGKHHDHLICGRCGQVIEFYSEKIEGLQNEVCRGINFVPEGHSLVIYGCCDRCGDVGGANILESAREIPDTNISEDK